MYIYISLFLGLVSPGTCFNEEFLDFCNSIHDFSRELVPMIPQNLQSPQNHFLPIQEGNQTTQPQSNQMADQWSDWEDSRQCPIGHPTPPTGLSKFKQ